MIKKNLKESITSSAIAPFSYIILIDATKCINKSRGYIKMIFPKENPDIIKSWFKKIIHSDAYVENKDKLESISTRFSGNPQLMALFNTLQKIKSISYAEDEKDIHEKDIQKMIEKIGLYVKRRLTDDDIKILDLFMSEINHVSEKISEKIDSDVEMLMASEEQMPVTPEPDVPEKEVSERMRNKFKKKIKEIVRTHLISNKYR